MKFKALEDGNLEVTEVQETKKVVKASEMLKQLNQDIRALKQAKSNIDAALKEKIAARKELRADKVAMEYIESDREVLPIIANVTADGKIYHLPSDPTYDDVELDKSRGDLTFRTPKEAEKHGFTHVWDSQVAGKGK